MNQVDEILQQHIVAYTGSDKLYFTLDNVKHELLTFLADYIEATPEQRNKLQILLGDT